MIFKLALQELRYGLKRLRWVIFILFIGFVGPFFASAFRSSVAEYLATSSKRLLSADLAISSQNDFTKEQRDWLANDLKPAQLTEMTEFVTMGKGRDVATLVEVEGVDANFPIYGSFKVRGSATPDLASLNAVPSTWVYPEMLADLGLKVGDSLRLGNVDFRILGVLDDAPGLGRTGGFAPRIFIARKFVESTGLITFGSQISHKIFLRLPQGLDIDDASDRVEVGLNDTNLNVRTPDDAIQGFERFFRFFNMYLVAVTMIVFMLSWTGAFYCLQIFLQDRLKNAAVLIVNGASRWRVSLLYSLQVLFVMMFAFAAAGAFVLAGLGVARVALASRLPEGFVLGLSFDDVLKLAGLALISSFVFNVPFYVRLSRLKVVSLLRESSMGREELTRFAVFASYIPLALIFLAVSVDLMESWVDALRLAGGMAAAALIGLGLGRVLFLAFYRSVRLRPGLTRLVALQLARSRFGVQLCFIALVLSSLALNLVPHLLNSVLAELEPLEGREIPALFLFNIPDSELDAVKSFAVSRGVELRFLSPMVLGRLTKANGVEPHSDQLQRFPVRLSYRSQRIPSESLREGREFSPFKEGDEAEVSVEEKFAARNDFHLNDELEFDIQGIPIKAHIVSLRHIQWTTFNPNFFIMFQPGVLDDAPKTWIANVNFDVGAPGGEDKKVRVQYELTRDHPAVSVIDIGRTVTRVLEIARSVILPTETAAGIAVLMSFLVLIGIVAHNLRLRERELEIEKILGADASLIRSLIVAEYFVTSLLAWAVGAVAAAVLAFAIAHLALEVTPRFSGVAILVSLFAIVGVTVLIAYTFATQLLGERGTRRRL